MQAFGTVVDNGRTLVITAFGTNSQTVEIWDTVTNEVYYSPHTSPDGIEAATFKVQTEKSWQNNPNLINNVNWPL